MAGKKLFKKIFRDGNYAIYIDNLRIEGITYHKKFDTVDLVAQEYDCLYDWSIDIDDWVDAKVIGHSVVLKDFTVFIFEEVPVNLEEL